MLCLCTYSADVSGYTGRSHLQRGGEQIERNVHARRACINLHSHSEQAYTVYREVIQPRLEQRRRDEEDEWNAQEMERAMQLSILEHQHEEQRRVDQERWEQTHLSSQSTSSSARYDGDTGIMRRRRHADVSTSSFELPAIANMRRPTNADDAFATIRLALL